MNRNHIEKTRGGTFLPIVRRAARQCGVTRLGDITGLDRLGLPVWQAIRPGSHSLSVHQGKGLTHIAAQVGALCEAIESHSAEQVAADGPSCALAALRPTERLTNPDDLLVSRDRPHDWAEPIVWCLFDDLVSGRAVCLPHCFASLDFRGGFPSRIERSSNGLGAGPNQANAIMTALFELIERDALTAWARMGIAARMASHVEPATIPFAWFSEWRDRLEMLSLDLEVLTLATLTGAPSFRCVISGTATFGGKWRISSGSAAHPDAEIALAKAFAEAAQSRLTLIAGARDDIYPRRYEPGSDLPDDDDPDEGPPGRPWRDYEPITDPVEHSVTALGRRGYRQVLFKRLDRDLDGVVVVKAFVPGLGMLGRTRRVPE